MRGYDMSLLFCAMELLCPGCVVDRIRLNFSCARFIHRDELLSLVD